MASSGRIQSATSGMRLGSSGAAGALACNPIELVKVRLQSQIVGGGATAAEAAAGYTQRGYVGVADCFTRIAREEGVAAARTARGAASTASGCGRVSAYGRAG